MKTSQPGYVLYRRDLYNRWKLDVWSYCTASVRVVCKTYATISTNGLCFQDIAIRVQHGHGLGEVVRVC